MVRGGVRVQEGWIRSWEWEEGGTAYIYEYNEVMLGSLTHFTHFLKSNM